MTPLRWVILTLCLAIAMLGCHLGLERRLVGTYVLAVEKTPDSDLQTQLAENALNATFGAQHALELREDGTFVGGSMGPVPIRGRWRLEGLELVLEPEQVGDLQKGQPEQTGKDLAPFVEGAFEPLRMMVDPSTLTLHSVINQKGGPKIVLRRKEQN